MISDLQTTLRWLAEKAGYDLHYVRNGGDTERYYFYYEPDVKPLKRVWLPCHNPRDEGRRTTLTPAECWTVLAWLAKAGYFWENDIPDDGYILRIESGDLVPLSMGHGDTLALALVAALLALPMEGAKA